LELFLRALRRRGYIDDDDMHVVERDLDMIHKATSRQLDYTRQARRNPKDAMKGE